MSQGSANINGEYFIRGVPLSGNNATLGGPFLPLTGGRDHRMVGAIVFDNANPQPNNIAYEMGNDGYGNFIISNVNAGLGILAYDGNRWVTFGNTFTSQSYYTRPDNGFFVSRGEAAIKGGLGGGFWQAEAPDVFVYLGSLPNTPASWWLQFDPQYQGPITALRPFLLSANATDVMQAVPLQQLNSAIAGVTQSTLGGPFLPLAGGTMTNGAYLNWTNTSSSVGTAFNLAVGGATSGINITGVRANSSGITITVNADDNASTNAFRITNNGSWSPSLYLRGTGANSSAHIRALGSDNSTEVFRVERNGTIKAPNFNYSTTEQLTGGTWIDGKPIYQKTVLCSGAASTTPHSIIGFDHVVAVDAVWLVSGMWVPVPAGNMAGLAALGVAIYVNSTVIGFAGVSSGDIWVTVKYTKF